MTLLLAGLGLGLRAAGITAALLIAAAVAAAVGAGLLWRSRSREPRPWRLGDASHYERRFAQRPRR